MIRKIIVLALALIIGVIVMISGCSPTGQAVKNEDGYDIGVILPLSGNAVYYGDSTQKGVEIAKQEIESDYEIQFNVYYGDSEYTPKGGVTSYRQLMAAHDLDGVVTAASTVSLAISPLVRQEGVLQMAVMSSGGVFEEDLTFRVSTISEIETKEMARFIEKMGYDKIGIIYVNNDYGVSYKDTLIEALNDKSRVSHEEAILMSEVDYKSILLKMRDADAIFMVGIAAQYSRILIQANELGIDAQFLSIRSVEDPVLIKNAGELADGLIYTYPFDASQDHRFVRAFVERYGRVPDAYAAEGYEGFKLVALAFIECDKDYECVYEYLTGLRDYESVFGKLSFDKNGDVYYNYFIKQVEDGEFVALK